MGGTAVADNAPEHVVKYGQNLMTSVGARFANVAAAVHDLDGKLRLQAHFLGGAAQAARR